MQSFWSASSQMQRSRRNSSFRATVFSCTWVSLQSESSPVSDGLQTDTGSLFITHSSWIQFYWNNLPVLTQKHQEISKLLPLFNTQYCKCDLIYFKVTCRTLFSVKVFQLSNITLEQFFLTCKTIRIQVLSVYSNIFAEISCKRPFLLMLLRC